MTCADLMALMQKNSGLQTSALSWWDNGHMGFGMYANNPQPCPPPPQRLTNDPYVSAWIVPKKPSVALATA